MADYAVILYFIIFGVYVWMGSVAVRKGHAVWLWSLLIPFAAFFAIPYAASQTAKPGTDVFRKYKPGGPKAMKSIRTYPGEAEKAGLDHDGFPIQHGDEGTTWVDGMPQKLYPEATHEPPPPPAIPMKEPQLTPQQQLAGFKSLHEVGGITDEQFERIRKRYGDLDDGES